MMENDLFNNAEQKLEIEEKKEEHYVRTGI